MNVEHELDGEIAELGTAESAAWQKMSVARAAYEAALHEYYKIGDQLDALKIRRDEELCEREKEK